MILRVCARSGVYKYDDTALQSTLAAKPWASEYDPLDFACLLSDHLPVPAARTTLSTFAFLPWP